MGDHESDELKRQPVGPLGAQLAKRIKPDETGVLVDIGMAADRRRAAIKAARHGPRRPGQHVMGRHAARKGGESVPRALQSARGVGSDCAGLVEMLMSVDKTRCDRQARNVDARDIDRD